MYIIFFKKNWGVTCVTCYIYKTLIWETHVTCGVTCGVTCITCQDVSSCSWWQFKFCLYYWFCTMCLLCLRFFWVGNDFCTRDFLRERERKIERDRERKRERGRETERSREGDIISSRTHWEWLNMSKRLKWVYPFSVMEW